ncbi:MAG TPA: AAA family ATPase [Coleofasciculaceae cyanobacterium]
MDLFEHHRLTAIAAEAPLAARMRPRTLDEFVGQEAILGPGRLLRRAIQADQLGSLIVYGPPGTGKTTLARVIANTTTAYFIAINAVLAGVKEIREAIATAQERRGQFNQSTILFVDEVHRFNKAQQDALLPWVENGTVILIGATTENPYFEVNKALVSRSRIFQLKALNPEDLQHILWQALRDPDRGYGQLNIQVEDKAANHLVNVANGDARALLNALELAVETTPADQEGTIHINLAVAEESIQKRAVLYDKEGDAHFDTISAFIKSVRGSDPDAALYWLARMVYAGEDPRFILRRLLILASEDVGMADPNAVVVVHACAAAFDYVGMPEGRYPLAQATLYLATCAKSNSVMAFFDALATIEQERAAEVPTHLRDPSRDQKGFGHGKGYLYPHAYRDHWVAQQYLPPSLQGQVFYLPSNQGFEAQIQTKVAQQREAQLAALVEGYGIALPEAVTAGSNDSAQNRWLQRTLSQAGEQLGLLRDRLFQHLALQRHHVVLDLAAGSGLLTWEAVRRVPEGGVYACVQTEPEGVALGKQASALPELSRPIILQSSLSLLPQHLQSFNPDLRFDAIIGRNALLKEFDKARVIYPLLSWLQPMGTIALAETLPCQGQRLYQLVEPTWLEPDLLRQWQQAEEEIYHDPNDPIGSWNCTEIRQMFEAAHFQVEIQVEFTATEIVVTPALLDRWFRKSDSVQLSYADRLAKALPITTIQQLRQVLERRLNQTVAWKNAIALIYAQPHP